MDELISKGEFPIQENLEVDHLLPEDVLTLQKVTRDLGLVDKLNSRLKALGILCKKGAAGVKEAQVLTKLHTGSMRVNRKPNKLTDCRAVRARASLSSPLTQSR